MVLIRILSLHAVPEAVSDVLVWIAIIDVHCVEEPTAAVCPR